MSANNKLRFVTKALYCMIAEECALEGAELKGLYEILEDASLEGQKTKQEVCGSLDTGSLQRIEMELAERTMRDLRHLAEMERG